MAVENMLAPSESEAHRSSVTFTAKQLRNIEILIFDARYWAKHKKMHSLTIEEIEELIELFYPNDNAPKEPN